MKNVVKIVTLSFILFFIFCLTDFFKVGQYQYTDNIEDVSNFLDFEKAIIDLNKKNTKEQESIVSLSLSNNTSEEQSSSNFKLQRLIVSGVIQNTYGASRVIKHDGLNILCYDSEEKTKYAYEKLLRNSNLKVFIDEEQKINEYAEKDYNYDDYQNWAAESADIGGYREFLENNNVSKEVVVVVMDTGINTSHTMFNNRLLTDNYGRIKGYSYYDSTYDYSYNNLAFDEDDETKYSFEDDDGHGSHVAGIICSLTPSNVKILPIKVGDEEGYSSTSIFISAYLRIINVYSKQYDIVSTNLSYSGGGKDSESEKNTFNEKCYGPLLDLNIIPVTAAGNDNSENNIEGLKAIVVSALKQKGNEYTFDNSYSNYGKIIDIAAPGTNILSAAISENNSSSSAMVSNQGTSMASPQVAGVVALLALNPNLPSNYTSQDIENALYGSALDLGQPGKDIYYGEGMLNLKYFETQSTGNLSFYKDGNLVEEYIEIENFTNPFTLEIECSNSDYEIIYTTNKSIPTIYDSLIYTQTMNIDNTISIYAMGIKIENNEIVERTNLYNISYFNIDTPLEDCLEIDGRGSLYNYTGNYTTLVVPEIFKGKEVVGIEISTFKYSNLEYVVLPESIVSISGYAFQYSKNLKYVYAPSVKKLYIAAFDNCESLKLISDKHPTDNDTEGGFFPNLEETIGFSFSNVKQLESISLSKLTTMGSRGYDFYNSPNLKSVNLPSITSISNGTFYMCSNLSGNFEIGEYVTSIGEKAFAGTKIEGFQVHQNNKNFYTDGLGVYTNSSLILYASGKENINYEILDSVMIDGETHTITDIGSYAVYQTKLKSVTIPHSIKVINGFAFDETTIETLYYNSINCSYEGYYYPEDYWRKAVFDRVNVIEIGHNVQNIPQRLFQQVYFDTLIINSKQTTFDAASFYRFKEQGNLDRFVLNFEEEVDEIYFDMIRKSSIVSNVDINNIYSKNPIQLQCLEIIGKFPYQTQEEGYYIYSNKQISNMYTIDSSSSEFGTVTPKGKLYLNEGQEQKYTFIPNEGYYVKNIIVDGVELENDDLNNAIKEGYTFSNVNENHTIFVVFAPNTYTIIYIDNEIILDANPQKYIYGEGATLPILVKEGYDFIGWYDNSNFEGNVITEISKIEKGDKIFYAKFELSKYIISVIQSSNGTISNSKSYYNIKENARFEIIPNKGYSIESLLIDGQEYKFSIMTEYTFENIMSNHTISAIFVPNVYTITYVDSNNEIILDATPHNYTYGEGAILPILFKKGYKFIGWYTEGNYQTDIIKEIEKDEIGNKVFYAKFEVARYTVSVIQPINGMISQSKSYYDMGEDAYFEITPDKGYHVESLIIDKVEYKFSNLTEYTFENISDNHSISVIFKANTQTKYTVRHWLENLDEDGNLVGDKYYNLEDTDNTQFGTTGHQTSAYRKTYVGFSALPITQKLILGDESTIIDIFYNRNIYDVNIKSAEGIQNVSGKGSYLYGETVKLKAVTKDGYVWGYWKSGNESIIVGSEKIEYEFSMPASSIEFGAFAVLKICSVTLLPTINGSVNILSGKENVCGANVELEFVADNGYKLKDLIIDGEDRKQHVIDGKLEMLNIGKEHVVSATFEEIFYKIEVEIEGNGKIRSDSDIEKLRYGSDVVIKIIPDTDNKIKNIYINGVMSNEILPTIKIENITSDVTIKIVFETNKKENKGGLSCSKKNDSEGSISDFLLIIFAVLGFAIVKKRIYK